MMKRTFTLLGFAAVALAAISAAAQQPVWQAATDAYHEASDQSQPHRDEQVRPVSTARKPAQATPSIGGRTSSSNARATEANYVGDLNFVGDANLVGDSTWSPLEEGARTAPAGSGIGCEPCNTQLTWGSLEYLMWWSKDRRLPPLVTTSPAGTPSAQAGVLGQPGTSILFGDERVGQDMRSGGRLTIGKWLDNCQVMGVGGRFYGLEGDSASFFQQSDGTPILAVPFFDVLSAQEDSQLVAYPGLRTGRITAENENDILGAESYLRWMLRGGGDYRFDLLAGYQFNRIDDSLVLNSFTTSIDTGSATPVGTTIDVTDVFDARNEFHGGELGIQGELQRGCWTVSTLVKMSLGNMHQSVAIEGSTVNTVPGSGSATFQNGLFAQSTNSGTFERDEIVYIPEVSATLGYKLTSNLDVSIGYSFIYWSSVVLAGDQIDRSINPSQLNDNPLIGPARPGFDFRDTDFWVQGINFGLSSSW